MHRRDFIQRSAAAGLTAAATVARRCRAAEVHPGDDCRTQLSAVHPKDSVVIHPFDGDVMQGSPPPRDKLVTLDTAENVHSHTVWAQQHVSELALTQAIPRGDGPVVAFQREPADIDGLEVEDLMGRRLTVYELLRKTYTDAFLVLHKGRALTEQYFSGMKPRTPHQLHSLGKSISIGVVANLLEERILRENACIVEYLPELAVSGYAGATVHHLLDMQSGVKYEYGDEDFRTSMSEAGRHFRVAGFRRKLPEEDPDGSQYEFYPTLKKSGRDHGEVFCYKCSDTGVLAWACERTTGQRFADLVSSHVWSKLGAEHDASMVCDAKGGPTPQGGISVTLRDLSRWGQMHLQGGTFNDLQIVPRGFIDDILRNANPAKVRNDSFPSRDVLYPGFACRSQFWVPGVEEGAYYAGGAFGQMCYIHPTYQTVIVKFSTHDTKALDLFNLEIHAFCQIAMRLGG